MIDVGRDDRAPGRDLAAFLVQALADNASDLRPHLGDELAVLAYLDERFDVPAEEQEQDMVVMSGNAAVAMGAMVGVVAAAAHTVAIRVLGIAFAIPLALSQAATVRVAAAAVPLDAVSVLLSHTPEIYRQAAHAGFDLMLCGHTHGGQICLPGGYPLILHVRHGRRYYRGLWRYKGMTGFTSQGCGTIGIPIRFNTVSEATLITLLKV